MENIWKYDCKLLKAQKRTVNCSLHENAEDWNPFPIRLKRDVIEHDVFLFTLSCNLIRQNIFLTNIFHAFNKTMSIVFTHLFHHDCNAVTLSSDISKPTVKNRLIFNLSSKECISSCDKHDKPAGHL